LDAPTSINVKTGLAGNGFEHGQVDRLAGAGTIEVNQVQAPQARIGKTLGYGDRVGIVGGLPRKIARA
jgi:hypothetical protein